MVRSKVREVRNQRLTDTRTQKRTGGGGSATSGSASRSSTYRSSGGSGSGVGSATVAVTRGAEEDADEVIQEHAGSDAEDVAPHELSGVDGGELIPDLSTQDGAALSIHAGHRSGAASGAVVDRAASEDQLSS